jgi:hypothetical protein
MNIVVLLKTVEEGCCCWDVLMVRCRDVVGGRRKLGEEVRKME